MANEELKIRDEVIYITADERRRSNKYSDPLILNFKFLIDFDSTHGLFGEDNPKYTDTAVAYLRRIGDTHRLEMLKTFTELFKTFIKKYDYLIKKIDGLDVIHNAHNSHSFYNGDDNKLTIETDEEVDMIVEALVFMYRKLSFDETRMVCVIPANLLRFDCKVLLYASGHYDKYYDVQLDEKNQPISSDDMSKYILPTKRKLNDDNDVTKVLELRKGYNHLLFHIEDCAINVEETGKNFVSSVSNDPSDDMVKNNLVIDFFNGTYDGMFNNLVGGVNWVEYLAQASLQNKYGNLEDNFVGYSSIASKEQKKNTFKDITKKAKDKVKEFGADVVDSTKTTLIDDGNKIINNLKDTGKNMIADTSLASVMLAQSKDKISANNVELTPEQKKLIINNFGIGLI